MKLLIIRHGQSEADEKYPYQPNLPIHMSVYEQESKLEFRYRAEYVLSKIISENKEDDTVVVVIHGGMINQLRNVPPTRLLLNRKWRCIFD